MKILTKFEQLKQIAEQEFNCTIAKSSTTNKTFEKLFGFSLSDIDEVVEMPGG